MKHLDNGSNQAKIVLLILLICLLPFDATLVAQKTEANAVEQKPVTTEVVIKTTAKELPEKDIYFGDFAETIKNPHCVQLITLLQNVPEYKELQKSGMKQGEARYWIRLATASEVVSKQIEAYAKSQKLTFVCSRKTLLTILKKQPEFKEQSEAKLIKQFDLTDAISDYAKTHERKSTTSNTHLNLKP